MNVSFLNVLITVLSLVILMIPGYILIKTKILNKKAEEVLSVFVLYCAQPMLMIIGFQKTHFSTDIAINMLICFGLAVLVHFIMIGIVFLVPNKSKDSKINCMRFASVFSNCGYMGLPFLQGLFSSSESYGEILIYSSVVIAVFNFLSWSIGILMVSGDKKQISVKNCLLNPTVICIFIGLIMFLIFQKPIVELAAEGGTLDLILTKFMGAIEIIANTVTPLSMVVIGMRFANIEFKRLLQEKWSFLSCFNKLILMSLVAILVVAFLPIRTELKYAIFFLLSMPSATATVLFAIKFGGNGDSASVTVLLSTLLSVVTIPLMFLLFKLCLGAM